MSPLTFARVVPVGLAAAALLAGCSSGRHDQVYIPDTQSVPEATSPPPVVSPAPVVGGAASAAPVVESRSAQATVPPVDDHAKQHEKDRKALRRERARAARARKRAAARERALRRKLAQARREEAKAKAGQQGALDVAADARPARPAKGDKAPVTGSNVNELSPAERDRRSDTEARASVIRFHELLDRHDASACNLLTPRLLRSTYGDDHPAAKCAAGVEAITVRVSVQILRSAASGRHALLDTVTYYGDQSIHQGLALVLVNGTWLIDVVQRQDDQRSAG